MNVEEHEIVIVGAGISGLSVAWHLHRMGKRPLLLDSRETVGGTIETERRDGYLLEKGPYNVMVRDPVFQQMLIDLGDEVEVIKASDEANDRFIYRRGRLHSVPTGPVAFMRSPLISFGGRLRAARGLWISSRGKKPETTIEEFAARRFGQEVADTIVSAAISGILAGDIRKLSAYASFPVLRDFDTRSISPMGRTIRRIPAMRRKKRDPKTRRKWKGLVSIDKGLGGMCHAMAAPLGDNVRLRHKVTSIQREQGRFVLDISSANGDQSRIAARQLILATPVKAAADLIAPHLPEAAGTLRTIESASLTVINMAFKRDDVGHALNGFGFLVPHNEPEFPLMGVLFADSAFPYHAPPDRRLLRVFFGGSRTADVLDRSDESLVATACKTIRDVLDVRGEPQLVDVCPYPNAIPQYYLDHPIKIASVREQIARLPGLTLAGNYLEGVSINDCVKFGKLIAEQVLSKLESRSSKQSIEAMKGNRDAIAV